jgi:phage baseplate assembly protein W
MARQFAVEDGNLQTRSIVTSRTVNYKDVDLTFSKKANNDIFKKEDAAAVKQAVKNILMTNPGEKPFRPFYGAVLNRFLFELSEGLEEDEIQDAVAEAISRDEPRAALLGVKSTVDADNNSIRVRVAFRVLNTSAVEEISIDLTRLR